MHRIFKGHSTAVACCTERNASIALGHVCGAQPRANYASIDFHESQNTELMTSCTRRFWRGLQMSARSHRTSIYGEMDGRVTASTAIVLPSTKRNHESSEEYTLLTTPAVVLSPSASAQLNNVGSKPHSQVSTFFR